MRGQEIVRVVVVSVVTVFISISATRGQGIVRVVAAAVVVATAVVVVT